MNAPVVCVGLATLDTIHVVPRHPAEDDRVLSSELAVAGGGPAATAAVTLARLGVQTFFVGAVGDDEAGAKIRDGLDQEGVDVSELAVVPRGRSPQSSILVGRGTRSIVSYRGALPPLALSARARNLCREAAYVHVDQTGYPAATSLRHEIRLSIDGGNPIDALDVDGVAVYAPTEAGLHRDFGSAQAALDAGAELVVVTRGELGSAAYTRAGEVVEASAPRAEVVSTLGAGDVFHGALLAQLLREAPLREALVFANECAVRSCRGLDGRSAIPTSFEVAT
jgi:sulfofructose kinase